MQSGPSRAKREWKRYALNFNPLTNAAQGQAEPAIDFQVSVGNDVLSFRLSGQPLGSGELMPAMPANLNS